MIAQFGSYEIDFDTVEIRRSGLPVPVQPQVFSVIEFLIGERHRVVTKEEVLDTVWGDRFVSESALTSRIKSARRALGDSGTEQAVIRTVLGRGYRFVAELTEAEAQQPIPPSSAGQAPRQAALADASSVETSALGHGEWPLVGRHGELAVVDGMLADHSVRGVLITGPEGIGATRFADEYRARAGQRGTATARIVGLRSASEIPLAAMSHLLPDDVLKTEQGNDGLAKAEILQRASRALEELAGAERLVVTIENADCLDQMSSTLIGNLLLNGSAFGIAVRSPLVSTANESTDADVLLRELPLRTLDETDVDIMLYRVLGGPIEPTTLRQIVATAEGRPGLVRDIVETSQAASTLAQDHGVWRFTGELASTAGLVWNPSSLSTEALAGAEVLALVTRLPEDTAVTVIGDAALEELDREHLLALQPNGTSHWVTLANPLLANAVRENIRPLRERRLKAELSERLLVAESDPQTIARIVTWHGERAGAVSDSVLLAASQTAMISGDMDTAGLLIEHVVDHQVPAVQLIEAEVALRRNQWERAEGLFDTIDVDGLDEISASHALRRRSAIQFYTRARFDETIDWLAAEAERRGGRSARALLSRRVGMLAFLGRADDTLEAAEALGDLHGLTAIEVMLSSGSAHLHRGRFDTTLSTLNSVDALIDELPEAWAAEPRDGVVTVRCSGLLHVGRLAEAVALSRQSLPVGKRTELGFFPSLAAMIELAAGRPRAAREMVRQAIASSHREAFPQYLAIAEALFARTDLAIGDLDAAAAGLQTARQSLTFTSGELHWLVAINIAQLAAGLGEPDPPEVLLELADDAHGAGAFMREADLLMCAALIDQSPTTAGAVLDRVEACVADFDGTYWPVRAQHLRSIVDGHDFAPVMEAYRSLGYHGFAT